MRLGKCKYHHVAYLLQKEEPNPRQMLSKLFMTRVKLEAPQGGDPQSATHRDQIQRDTEDVAAEKNHQMLLSVVGNK